MLSSLFLFFCFSLIGNSYGNIPSVKINSDVTINFVKNYEENVRFASVYPNSSSIITHAHNISECLYLCAILDDCVGVFNSHNDTLFYNPENRC